MAGAPLSAIANPRVVAAVRGTLDQALGVRVLCHRERAAGRLTVPEYKAGLQAVRDVEAALEPLRGAEHTRAYELTIQDRSA